MYAGEATIVTLPAVGRVHILKNGYVYWENDGKWDPVKKRTIDSRVSIGKLVPDTRDQLYPNKKYFELFDKNGQRLAPKPPRKPRKTKKQKIQELIQTASKSGLKPEEIAERLGLAQTEE